ncbi:MAG: hypothetical protein NVS4B11_30050 [Ktedonobacteraceae bacterium]
MKSIPPQLIALFCIMFIALGIFNILMARRRQMREGLQHIRIPWYKQVGILTGIEYILLASVFLLNIGISYKWLPPSLNGVIFPFFIILLLASGLLAGFVIYQGFTNMQRRRSLATRGVQVGTDGKAYMGKNGNAQTASADDMTPEERVVYMQKRRERRQKAASARRHRAGKA